MTDEPIGEADSGVVAPHQFGRWLFDASTGDLSDGSVGIRLEPQVAKLLAYFLTHQNVLSSRDDLIAAAWEGRIVSDDAINRCISILRHTLSRSDKNAYIETVRRRGFISHFPAPDRVNPAPPVSTSPISPGPISLGPISLGPISFGPISFGLRKLAIATAMLGIIAVIALLWAGEDLTSKPTPLAETSLTGTPMVAVLPFAFSGFAGESGFFANGVHDDLLTQLAQLESIWVISRTSVLEYRDTEKSIGEIGLELGADAILEGSVQRVGDQFRINVQLIDVRTDVHLWAQQYDRELLPAQIFQVQFEIASAIAVALQSTLSPRDSSRLNVLPTTNMAAYRAYHQALNIRDTLGVNSPGYLAALEQAVAKDPGFVRAWAHLAGFLCYQNFSRQDPDTVARIEQMLQRIHTLAPESADLLVAQSYYTYYILKDYESAYGLVEQAQLIRPSDERVVELKSLIERRLGNYAARSESLRLIQRLNPRNSLWSMILAINLAVMHRYDEALQELDGVKNRNLGWSVIGSTLAVRKHGDFKRWSAELEALEIEYAVSSGASGLWHARIAARDYLGAETLLGRSKPTAPYTYLSSPDTILEAEIAPLITYWLLGAEDRLQPVLTDLEAKIDQPSLDRNNLLDFRRDLILAYVAAARGNQDSAKRQIRLWQRAVTADKADYAHTRHYACRALGMAAATSEAVQCIRAALIEPSYAMPFIEPYLPYYDAIRIEPEFRALVAALEGAKCAGADADPVKRGSLMPCSFSMENRAWKIGHSDFRRALNT